MNTSIKLTLMAFFVLLSSYTFATEIYKWVDENGKVHYGDTAPKEVATERVTPDVNTIPAPQLKNVTMYATSWCGYCRKARQFFKQQGIAFTEYDIEKDEDAKQRYDEFGGKGIPIIFINQKRINGFDENRLKALLKP